MENNKKLKKQMDKAQDEAIFENAVRENAEISFGPHGDGEYMAFTPTYLDDLIKGGNYNCKNYGDKARIKILKQVVKEYEEKHPVKTLTEEERSNILFEHVTPYRGN
jgi:hypothetical protein